LREPFFLLLEPCPPFFWVLMILPLFPGSALLVGDSALAILFLFLGSPLLVGDSAFTILLLLSSPLLIGDSALMILFLFLFLGSLLLIGDSALTILFLFVGSPLLIGDSALTILLFLALPLAPEVRTLLPAEQLIGSRLLLLFGKFFPFQLAPSGLSPLLIGGSFLFGGAAALFPLSIDLVVVAIADVEPALEFGLELRHLIGLFLVQLCRLVLGLGQVVVALWLHKKIAPGKPLEWHFCCVLDRCDDLE
jgi:hypothetical protein